MAQPTGLFLERPNTPKRVLLIKVWITPYKPNISPVLCRCGIRLGCYIHPSLGTQSTRWGLPHHRSRGHAKPLWYHNVMTQPRPDKILSALSLNNAYTGLFLGRPYTPKRILPIKVWITPYKPSISPVLCRCEICLRCYNILEFSFMQFFLKQTGKHCLGFKFFFSLKRNGGWKM